MKTDKVFEILGEGGGICISRQQNKQGERFIYHHNEFDPTDESQGINENENYHNFEQAFILINNRYAWYRLHLELVHDDYKSYIVKHLIKRLNGELVTPSDMEYTKERLEKVLKIRLIYEGKHGSENKIWHIAP